MKIKELLKDPMLLFIFLNILDAVFTYIFLVNTHISHELNPIYKTLFGILGIGITLIILKIITILCMAYIYYVLIYKDKRYILIKAYKYINTFYIFIVLNNLYYVIFKL